MDPPHDTFSKVKDNTSISMHLTPTDTKQEIHLELFYLQNSKAYRLALTQPQIQAQYLKVGIETPEDLFSQIKANFDDLTIGPEGSIQFVISVGTKKKVVRLTTILTDHNVMAQTEKNHLHLWKEMKNNMTQMESNIADLKHLVEVQSTQIQILIEGMRQLKNTISHISHENQHLKSQLTNFIRNNKKENEDFLNPLQERSIKNLVMNILDYEEYSHQQPSEGESQDSGPEVRSFDGSDPEDDPQDEFKSEKEQKGDQIGREKKKSREKKFKEDIPMKRFCPNSQHEYNSNFRVFEDGRMLSRKDTDKNWHNFVMSATFRKGYVYTVTLKIVQSLHRKIQMGVISKRLFGKLNTLNEGACVTCDLKHFKVFRSGKKIQERTSRGMRDGEYVRMRVDRVQNRVEWLKRGLNDKDFGFVCASSLPRCLSRKGTIYPALSMIHNADTVQIVM